MSAMYRQSFVTVYITSKTAYMNKQKGEDRKSNIQCILEKFKNYYITNYFSYIWIFEIKAIIKQRIEKRQRGKYGLHN